MTWIKMRCDLTDDPAVIRMASLLKIDRFAVVGRLHKFWAWSDSHTVDGLVDWIDEHIVDELAAMPGFAKAMESVGWLEFREGAVALPKFDRHNGESAKKRADAAERQRLSRLNRTDEQKPSQENVTETKSASQPRVTDVTKKCDQRREEKIREEIPPIPPKGGKAGAISLTTYLTLCKAEGKKPIPEDDPVFAYASKAGIPQDFLRLHWLEFKDRYALPDAKRYKAWPTVFRKSVRGNWFRLWFIAPDGRCELTTTGLQAQRIHAEAA